MFTHALLANINADCSLYSPLLNPEDWEQISPPLAMVRFCLFVLFCLFSLQHPSYFCSQSEKNLSAAQTVFAAPQQGALWLRVNSNPPEVHKTISPLQSALRDKWQQKRLLFPHMGLNHLWMLCIALFYAAFAKTDCFQVDLQVEAT